MIHLPRLAGIISDAVAESRIVMFPRRGSGSCKLPFPSCLGYTADKDELVEAYSGNMAREPVVLNVYDMVSVQLDLSTSV